MFVLLFSMVASAEAKNTIGLKKDSPSGYATISIENTVKTKNNKIRNKTTVNKPAKHIKKSSTVVNTETIHLKTSANTAVVKNKTGQFVFRNITKSYTDSGVSDSLKARTSNIDYLRNRLKRY